MLKNNNEFWKDMIGYEGQYQVSDFGRIRAIRNNHGQSKIYIKKLYIRSKTCNYKYVSLCVKGKVSTEAVHRAVAKAFIPNPENKPMVNHLNGNKLKNNASNLEWCTCSENHKHAYKTGLKVGHLKMIGTKFNAKSNYRNVSWDSIRSKWIGSIKHKGKLLMSKRFNTEIEAAKHVNYIIDFHKLNRPRNVIV